MFAASMSGEAGWQCSLGDATGARVCSIHQWYGTIATETALTAGWWSMIAMWSSWEGE